MLRIQLKSLSLERATQTVAATWACVEEFGLRKPSLDVIFNRDKSVTIQLHFEALDDVSLAAELLLSRLQSDVDLCVPAPQEQRQKYLN
jgi:hypothetical protein